jgi:hypothetical protein
VRIVFLKLKWILQYRWSFLSFNLQMLIV